MTKTITNNLMATKILLAFFVSCTPRYIKAVMAKTMATAGKSKISFKPPILGAVCQALYCSDKAKVNFSFLLKSKLAFSKPAFAVK